MGPPEINNRPVIACGAIPYFIRAISHNLDGNYREYVIYHRAPAEAVTATTGGRRGWFGLCLSGAFHHCSDGNERKMGLGKNSVKQTCQRRQKHFGLIRCNFAKFEKLGIAHSCLIQKSYQFMIK